MGVAAIYARISQDRDGERLGVTRQTEDCQKLADTLGHRVGAVFTDNDISASTRSRKPRPQFEEMMRRAETGEFAALLFWNTRRLTRRPMEYERLIRLVEKYGVRLASVKSGNVDLTTADGRAIARTLAAWDAAEAERNSEQVARACLQRAQRGLNHGSGRAFGYAEKGMVLVPDEAAELVRMYEQLLAGVPLGAIARGLHERGVQTVRGGKWAPGTVRDALRRARNAGLAVHRGEVVGKGQWPAVVTEEVWRAAVALLDDPSRRTSTGNKAAYLLSGLARCGVCGSPVTSSGLRAGTKLKMYRCRAGYCVMRRLDWIDDYVAEVILQRLSRPDAADLLIDGEKPDAGQLRADANTIQQRLDDAAAAYADGAITASQLRTATERLRARLAEIEAAQAHIDRGPVLGDLVRARDVRAVWDGLPLDRRRAVVESLVTVTLHKGGTGRKFFDPTRVDIVWKADL